MQTLEGLADDGGLSALQQAFWDSHAFQCGYCLSGMLFAAGDLLERVDVAHRRGDPRGDQRQPVPLHRLRPDRRRRSARWPHDGAAAVPRAHPRRATAASPATRGSSIDRDVFVPMRDGVRLCVDVYRPEHRRAVSGAARVRDLQQGYPGRRRSRTRCRRSRRGRRCGRARMEAGDTRFFVSRGYVHVIGSPRGVGKSEGGGSREWDCYDLIEWIAAAAVVRRQCRHGRHFRASAPSSSTSREAAARRTCKAIFPFDPRGAYGELGGFREEYPGGVIAPVPLSGRPFLGALHQHKGAPGALPPEQRGALAGGDGQSRLPDVPARLQRRLRMKGQHMPPCFEMLIDPYEQRSDGRAQRGGVRADQGADLHGLGLVRLHLQDPPQRRADLLVAQSAGRRKKLLFAGPAHLERPFHALHGEILRWYDHWLKGIDTGIMDEPPVRFWVMGANEWRTAERLAAAGNAVDQALSEQLGAPAHRAVHASSGRRPHPARRFRADAAVADERRRSGCAT